MEQKRARELGKTKKKRERKERKAIDPEGEEERSAVRRESGPLSKTAALFGLASSGTTMEAIPAGYVKIYNVPLRCGGETSPTTTSAHCSPHDESRAKMPFLRPHEADALAYESLLSQEGQPHARDTRVPTLTDGTFAT